LALRKKGTRRITVDGAVYRWRVVGGARCCIACAWGRFDFAAEKVDQNGPVLLAYTSAFPVVPSVVEVGIRRALSKGWRPEQPGPAFHLDADVLVKARSAPASG